MKRVTGSTIKSTTTGFFFSGGKLNAKAPIRRPIANTAIVGLLFWFIYVLKYVLGAPLFLAASEEIKLAYQIGFGIYGYLTLLVGVFIGAVYQEIKAAKTTGSTHIKIIQITRQALNSADFWLGIFASPVVYAVLLQAVNMEEISVGGFIGLILVGLQNGFVCNTIAESMINAKLSSNA